jgi:toxin ParE1/3/4
VKKRCIIRSPVYRAVIEQAEYYGQHSGDELAFRFFEAGEATYRFLLRNPSIGKPCRIPRHRALGVREFGIKGFPRHLVFYRAIPDGIEILKVVHAARDLETLLEVDW